MKIFLSIFIYILKHLLNLISKHNMSVLVLSNQQGFNKIWWFSLYETYKYKFYVFMYYDLEHWWSLASFWPNDFKENVSQSGLFKKKSYCPQTRLILWNDLFKILIFIIYRENYYFSISLSLNLVSFSFNSFFHWARDFAYFFFPFSG